MKGDLNIIGDAVRKYRKAKKWTMPKLAIECQLMVDQLNQKAGRKQVADYRKFIKTTRSPAQDE